MSECPSVNKEVRSACTALPTCTQCVPIFIVSESISAWMIYQCQFFIFSFFTTETFKDFKSELHKLFPLIHDTKFIAFEIRRNPVRAFSLTRTEHWYVFSEVIYIVYTCKHYLQTSVKTRPRVQTYPPPLPNGVTRDVNRSNSSDTWRINSNQTLIPFRLGSSPVLWQGYYSEQTFLSVPEKTSRHRARARALPPRVVLGHRSWARALV